MFRRTILSALFSLLLCVQAFAACGVGAGPCYWVGGSGTWDTTTATNWASTSGGVGGISAPPQSSQVVFDGNSGGGTVTYTVNGFSRGFASTTFTGFTGTFTGTSALKVNISSPALTLDSGMTWSHTGLLIFQGPSATLTAAGKTFGGVCQLDGGVTIVGDLACTGFEQTSGTVDFGGYNGTFGYFQDGTASQSARTLTITNSTITITGSNAANPVFQTQADATTNSASFTLNSSGSTIKFTNATSSNKTFQGGGATWGTVWFSGSGTGTFIVEGESTFGTFKVDTPPHSIQFLSGKTQTISTWDVAGTSGNLMTITASTGGSAATLSDSTGTNTCNYCSIQDSAATGGATWEALTGSTNVSGNTGWNFGGAAFAGRRGLLLGVGP